MSFPGDPRRISLIVLPEIPESIPPGPEVPVENLLEVFFSLIPPVFHPKIILGFPPGIPAKS